MSAPTLGALDLNAPTLRGAVSAVDAALHALTRAKSDAEREDATRRVLASWSLVRQLLALGPEPAPSECPRCGHTVEPGAARCGHCWCALAAS